jgi:6-phosphogluconolactonase
MALASLPRNYLMKRSWFNVCSALAIALASLAAPLHAQFAYVTDGYEVLGYRIDSVTGALTQVVGSPFTAGFYPISVAVDPSGKFVYVTLPNGGIFGLKIDASTGALTPIPGSPFAAQGADPNCIAFAFPAQ